MVVGRRVHLSRTGFVLVLFRNTLQVVVLTCERVVFSSFGVCLADNIFGRKPEMRAGWTHVRSDRLDRGYPQYEVVEGISKANSCGAFPRQIARGSVRSWARNEVAYLSHADRSYPMKGLGGGIQRWKMVLGCAFTFHLLFIAGYGPKLSSPDIGARKRIDERVPISS